MSHERSPRPSRQVTTRLRLEHCSSSPTGTGDGWMPSIRGEMALEYASPAAQDTTTALILGMRVPVLCTEVRMYYAVLMGVVDR